MSTDQGEALQERLDSIPKSDQGTTVVLQPGLYSRPDGFTVSTRGTVLVGSTRP